MFNPRHVNLLIAACVTIVVLAASTTTGILLFGHVIHAFHVQNSVTGWTIAGAILAGVLLLNGLLFRSLNKNNWRFQTRSLFASLTLIAVLLAVLGRMIFEIPRRDYTRYNLAQSGVGTVGSEFQFEADKNWIHKRLGYDPFDEITELVVRQQGGLEAILENSERLDDLEVIAFYFAGDKTVERAGELNQTPADSSDVMSCKLTDAGFESLSRWTNLKALCINGSDITDEGLAHIAKLPKLELLYVLSEGAGKLSFGDEGLRHIGQIKTLRRLVIGESNITDAGIPYLAGLSNLRLLRIKCVPITDECLPSLSALTQIESLSFDTTNVTADGLERLARALPKCTVHSNAPGWEPTFTAAE